MESGTKKIFEISGYLIRSFVNGLEGIAKHIESLTRPPGDLGSESETHQHLKTERSSQTTVAQSTPKPEKPTPPRTRTQGPTKTDIILSVINSAEEGIDVDAIAQETGFDKNTIRSTASRLKRQGKIKSTKQGVYAPA